MPRRRRYAQGGGGLGCCGCCTYWNQDEEEVAQQMIKERATGSIFGKAFCFDCDRGYGRHNVKCGYIFAGIMCGLLFIITMSYSAGVYRPALYMEKFKKAECTVDLIVWDANTTDECHWDTDRRSTRVRHHEYYYDSFGRRRSHYYYSGGRQDSGWRIYKCLQIYVTYQPASTQNRSITSAMLVDGYEHMKSGSDDFSTYCTTRPSSCSRHGDLEEKARNMERYYRTKIGNNPFECIYNPENLEEVTPPSDHDLGAAYRNLVLLSLVLTLIIILLIFMCCTCGCRYVCMSAVPQEITMEVNKRQAENQGLTVADPAAPPGGNVIYVGQPMQMVPAHTGAAQPPMMGPQPMPMHPMPPGQAPVGPQYGQYPPPGMQAPPAQGYYPAPQQPGFPAPQSGYPAPQPQYPPPQQGAYPSQGPGQPPAYAPAMAPQAAGVPQPPAPIPIPAGAPAEGYQTPNYTGLNAEAQPLPEKPPI